MSLFSQGFYPQVPWIVIHTHSHSHTRRHTHIHTHPWCTEAQILPLSGPHRLLSHALNQFLLRISQWGGAIERTTWVLSYVLLCCLNLLLRCYFHVNYRIMKGQDTYMPQIGEWEYEEAVYLSKAGMTFFVSVCFSRICTQLWKV